jgi:uncharacterized membrane protein SpoIIM required for sporulation
MLGGFAGAYVRSGAGAEFWITVMPHGTLELSAIVLAGGSGLLMGYSLWCPGDRSRRLALRESATVAMKLAIGLIPAFVAAGLIEGFITPSQQISEPVKLGIGILVAAVFWAYWLLGGRGAGASLAEAATASTAAAA